MVSMGATDALKKAAKGADFPTGGCLTPHAHADVATISLRGSVKPADHAIQKTKVEVVLGTG